MKSSLHHDPFEKEKHVQAHEKIQEQWHGCGVHKLQSCKNQSTLRCDPFPPTSLCQELINLDMGPRNKDKFDPQTMEEWNILNTEAWKIMISVSYLQQWFLLQVIRFSQFKNSPTKEKNASIEMYVNHYKNKDVWNMS